MSTSECATYYALKHILDTSDDDVVTTDEIARHIGCHQQTVKTALKRLRKAGLVSAVGTHRTPRYTISRNWMSDVINDE